MLLMITVLPMHHVVHDLIHHQSAHTHVHHHHHAVLTDVIPSLLFIVIGLLQVCHSITVVYHAAHYHAATHNTMSIICTQQYCIQLPALAAMSSYY